MDSADRAAAAASWADIVLFGRTIQEERAVCGSRQQGTNAMKRQKISKRSLLCYTLFVAMCVFIILLKKQMHVDEYISYGSANHIGNLHIDVEDCKTYTLSDTPFLRYMAADRQDRFNYRNVWQNQAADVHPPLYYTILHTICSLFPGTFSFWYAGAVNIVFGVMTLYVLRRLLRAFCGNDAPVNLLSATYIVSAGVMSSISFFRMYVMAMFFVTLISLCFVEAVGKPLHARFYGAIAAVSVLGALTHYYFIVYLVLICIVFGIDLLLCRKYKELGLFAVSMAGAGGLSIAIFPPMLRHIFSGYRGKESIDNLLVPSLENYLPRLRAFWDYISTELFGGSAPFILLTAAVIALSGISFLKTRKISARKKPTDSRASLFKWILLAVPASLYFLLVSRMAVYVADRYLFPIYAVVLCLFTSMVYLSFRKITNVISAADLATLLLCGVVILCSWKNTTWNYIYRNEGARFKELEKYRETDCIIVYDHRWKTESTFLEASIYNSVTFFPLADPELIDTFELSPDSLIVLAVGDNDEIIRLVSDKFPQLDQHIEAGSYAYSTTYYFYRGS